MPTQPIHKSTNNQYTEAPLPKDEYFFKAYYYLDCNLLLNNAK